MRVPFTEQEELSLFSISIYARVEILPFHNTSAPARLRLPVPHVSTKPLKSSLSLHAKILFYIWNEQIKYCNKYYYEVFDLCYM